MSDVDPTVIKDSQRTRKADVRNQLAIIKEELEVLERATTLPRRTVYDSRLFDEN